jgi:hypothetical protein
MSKTRKVKNNGRGRSIKKKRDTRQRGGAINVLRNQSKAIEYNISELSKNISGINFTEFIRALDDSIRVGTEAGKRKETETDIKFYVDQMLKDDKGPEVLFPPGTVPPTEYVEMLRNLSDIQRLRDNTDTLMKLLYRYINLRLSYEASSVGMLQQTGDGWKGRGVTSINSSNTNRSGIQPEFTREGDDNLSPQFTRKGYYENTPFDENPML